MFRKSGNADAQEERHELTDTTGRAVAQAVPFSFFRSTLPLKNKHGTAGRHAVSWI
jgi:hypothetical protein